MYGYRKILYGEGFFEGVLDIIFVILDRVSLGVLIIFYLIFVFCWWFVFGIMICLYMLSLFVFGM